ncbi:hypothetical protein [Nocardia cyriacigeorgica]|uniref:hypothetical protein n=2 Tax=Nocardia cyriacigeorgica TaxID=135487 RepID=UPI001E5B2B52|nr:hypothetical protein [Nocardia cyriacigeorgica]
MGWLVVGEPERNGGGCTGSRQALPMTGIGMRGFARMADAIDTPQAAGFSAVGVMSGRPIPKGPIMSTPMDREAADRIAHAAERDPDSGTATSGFVDRADAAAERNDNDD